MTSEERANKVVDDWLADQAIKHNGSSIRGPIAAAIRDAVAEAIQLWEEAAHNRAAQRARSWTELDQARDALEPFARLGSGPYYSIVTTEQVSAARDAWLALGGKIE